MRVEYLPLARADIARTVSYLVNRLAAPQAAEDLLNELDTTVQSIQRFPYAFSLYRTERPLRSEVRFAPVKNYVLYYVVLEDRVQIRRFLHGRQDRTSIKL